MFVMMQIEDSVEIRGTLSNQRNLVYQSIISKYESTIIKDLGIVSYIYPNIKMLDSKLYNSIIIVNVQFEIIILKFYESEICSGEIVKETEDGIWIKGKYFSNFFVKPENLYEESEYKNGTWRWLYGDSVFMFKLHDHVNFRVKVFDYSKDMVECAMDEPGLGPTSWWD